MPDLDIHVTNDESTLTVSVSGEYGYGSTGNQDASNIISAIDAAVLTNTTAELIIDLTSLNYEWGDAIGRIFHKYRNHKTMFLLPSVHAHAWKGILTMTWPAWSDQLGKTLRFI